VLVLEIHVYDNLLFTLSYNVYIDLKLKKV